MNDEQFFSATPELRTIYQWARARYAAPWAVFGAVLLRVSASTGPEVQLPGIIGGRASLNLLAAFVSPSGGGKGISDKVAREVWPAPIIERPIGSGEGIAATFMPPKKDGQEPITRAIFSVPEIDTLAGIAGRQGSILLAQLKSMAMGELLGQSNASDATTRIVQAHSYRCCLSVGAQPGHCGVIFSDTSGGTPQRFLWFPTTDPDMPATPATDPGPLNTALPSWSRASTDVVEIQYGPEEIALTVIAAHIARQRGDSEALDGHRLLTRLKVAAVLAVMHHRMVVSELDWQLSETVMAVSDRTRDWILSEAKRAERAKVRDRAIGRAVFDEIIDDRHATTVRNRVLRLLANGPMSRSDLRRAMGKQHYRESFDALLPHLEKIRQVVIVQGDKAPHYALNPEFTGEPEFTPENRSSGGVNHEFTGEPSTNVTDLDSRRSRDSERPKLSCQKWLNQHVEQLRAAGHTTIESFAVIEAGQALGYTKGSIHQAVSAHPDMRTVDRKRGRAVWSITPDYKPPRYESADAWLESWLDKQDTETVLPDDAKIAGEAAGHNWESVRRAASYSHRIESIPAHGEAKTERIWKIVDANREDAS
ncbi:hypothetical protein ACP6C7_04125 [Mycolicibacterium septicum]|uniref:DUF3987 domain-containing protein n=1 Tax=Mycolicibacterium septicum TaxID=98668 RepID=A0ABW9LNE7_9MYCO